MNIFILLIKNEVVVEWLYLVFPIFEPTSLQWYNKQDWSESMTDIIAHRGVKAPILKIRVLLSERLFVLVLKELN